jgi:fructose-1,6-bisphosphatase/inositol monophosphatase family enzyme
MVAHSGLITVMLRAARKAAPRLRRDFGEVEQLQVSKKGPADFVSMADKRAEQTILEELRSARPDCAIQCEESGYIGGNPTSRGGSSIRWTARPTSSMACRTSPFRLRSRARRLQARPKLPTG